MKFNFKTQNIYLISLKRILILTYILLAILYYNVKNNFIFAYVNDNFKAEIIFNLKSNIIIPTQILTIGDICDIKFSENIRVDKNKILNLQIGGMPQPFTTRYVYKYEIENIIKKNIEFPPNVGYKINGNYVVVTFIQNDNLINLKEFKEKLENEISKFFKHKYYKQFQFNSNDKIITNIKSNLNYSKIKEIFSKPIINIEFISYNSSFANLEIKYENEILSKLDVQILRETTVLCAKENLLKNSSLNFNQLTTCKIKIFAEKFNEWFLIEDRIENNKEILKVIEEKLELKRDVLKGQPIKKSYLHKKIVIKAGDQISLIVKKNNSLIKTNVIAINNGSIEDIIEVINKKTNKKYKAKVINKDEVIAITD